jgi:hypothetical protein
MNSLIPYVPQIISRPKKKKSQVNRSGLNPATSAVIYRGPYEAPNEAQQNDTFTTQVNLAGTVAASGAGVVSTVFDSYSQASSSPSWASLLATWREFRILSMKTELSPINKYNQPTTNVLFPVYSIVDRINSTALASAADAAQFNSVKIHDPSTRITLKAKMSDVGEAEWIPNTTSPNADDRMFFKLYSAGNSNGINLYDYITKVMVQFKGRE